MITNDILKKALRFSGKVGVLASEEEDKPVSVDGSLKGGIDPSYHDNI